MWLELSFYGYVSIILSVSAPLPSSLMDSQSIYWTSICLIFSSLFFDLADPFETLLFLSKDASLLLSISSDATSRIAWSLYVTNSPSFFLFSNNCLFISISLSLTSSQLIIRLQKSKWPPLCGYWRKFVDLLLLVGGNFIANIFFKVPTCIFGLFIICGVILLAGLIKFFANLTKVWLRFF